MNKHMKYPYENGIQLPVMVMSSQHMYNMAQNTVEWLSRLEGMPIRAEFQEIEHKVFPNGEVKPRFEKSVRGMEVYLFLNLTHPTVNEAIFIAQLEIDMMSRAGAKEIVLVVPHIPYLRQDRKDMPHVPLSAKVIIDNLQHSSKVARIITVDMHSDQAEMAFDKVMLDHLVGRVTFASYLRDRFVGDMHNVVICTPDHGGAVRAGRFAKTLRNVNPIVYISKSRTDAGTEILDVSHGDLTGKTVLIYDDMIDTGGTIINAAKVLKDKGAELVIAVSTHAVLSTKDGVPTVEKFGKAGIELVVTNSILHSGNFDKYPFVTVLSLSELFADAICESIRPLGSVSRLFHLPAGD